MNTLDFDKIYQAHYDKVVRYCQTILQNREDAEDIAQVTFLAAWQHWHSYEPVKDILYWLIGIARHRCLEAIRRNKVRTCDIPINYGAPINPWHEIDSLIDTCSCLSTLTPRQREMLLHTLQYGDYRTACMHLGIKRKPGHALLQRARHGLSVGVL